MKYREIKKVISIVCLSVLLSSNVVNAIAFSTENETNGNNVSQTVTSSVYENSSETLKETFVGLKEGVDSDKFIQRKGYKSSKTPRKIKVNTLALKLTKQEKEELINDPEVSYVENVGSVSIASEGKISKVDNEIKKMKDNSQTTPWGIHSIGADWGDQKDKNGKDIKVAILDTGVSKHPDLKISGGISFVGDSKNYEDDNGHGTHVAGTIVSQNNKMGTVGVAPLAEVFAVKVLDQDGTGSYENIIKGIEWAINHDINVISMSFGGLDYSEALHQEIIEASNKGIVLVAAAGNKGIGQETELYPARYPEVISVGAVDKSHNRAQFSSTGSELDIMAPGVNILSTTNDGGYGVLSGTSMATPHVTGAVAELWSNNKKWSSEEVREKIFDTATVIENNKNEYGNGLLNLARALGLTNDPIPSIEEVPGPSTPPTDVPFIKAVDAELLGLSNKLLSLKQIANEQDLTVLAKQIEEKYQKLLILNQEYHNWPQNIQNLTKEEKSSTSTLSTLDDYYKGQASKFNDLINLYNQSIVAFAGQIPLKQESTIDNPRAQIDTYEYNGDTANATPVNLGNTYASYISTSTDLDYYRLYTGSSSGTLNIQLQVPSGKDYDVYVYDSSNNTMVSGTAGAGVTENINFYANSSSYYYIKVYGYGGANNDAAAYYLTIGNLAPAIETLYLNTPVDVSLSSGQYKVYRFTPGASGNYKFFTGPYGGYGANNDTVLELYYDSSLTSSVPGGTNDDVSGSGNNFSTTTPYLNGGTTYYLKLRHFSSSGSVYARLTVTVPPPPLSTLYVDTPVDTQVSQGQYNAYQFTATQTGRYIINTSSYGNSGQSSDTYLHLYSDSNLTNQISVDDDSDGTLFSAIEYYLYAGTTYYIKFRGYNDSSSSARLAVRFAPDWNYTEITEKSTGRLLKVYVSNYKGDPTDSAPQTQEAHVITVNDQNQPIEKRFTFTGSYWSLVGSYAYNGGNPPGVASLGLNPSDVNATGLWDNIKNFDFDGIKNDILDTLLGQIGLARSDFNDEDLQKFTQGIAVGLDDNVLFGLYNAWFGLDKYENDAFYLTGHLAVDSASVTAFADLAMSASATSKIADAVSKAALVGAAALSETGIGGAALGTVSVGSKVTGVVAKVVAAGATAATLRSASIMASTADKLANAPKVPSQLLKENMVANGESYPPYKFATHHIVPSKDNRFAVCEKLRSILRTVGIDINDAKNGTFLPYDFGTGSPAVVHRGSHPESYYNEVYRRLSSIDLNTTYAKSQVEAVLNQIKQELLNGTAASYW